MSASRPRMHAPAAEPEECATEHGCQRGAGLTRMLRWGLLAAFAVALGYAGALLLRPLLLPMPELALRADLPSEHALARGVITLLTPAPEPVPQPGLERPRRLRLERLDGTPLLDVVPFDAQGEPQPQAFAQINKAFAAQGGEQVSIDPRLIELLMSLSAAYDDQPVALVSGHRTPGRGTRRTSYHVKGMAADVAMRGVPVHDVREHAVRLGAWGVGVYPKFVHIDVRRDQPYRWVGGRWPRGWRRRRYWRKR